MTEFIEQHRPALAALCRRHHVRTLELFGSAADGSFQPDRSDLDLLVDFQPMAPSDHSRAYFGLWFALEDLFGRKVDLVEVPAVTNPYFLQTIRRSRRMVYGS
jgi:predicted nucleotidyltransferase